MSTLLRITTVPISLHKLIKGQAKHMQTHGLKVCLASAEGKEIEQVKLTEQVPHYTINYTREVTPIKDLRSLWQTIKLIKKIKPSIVHTHTPKAGLIGMMAAWYCRVPHRLHTIAGLPLLESKGLKRVLLNKMEQLTSFCATSILPNSFQLKKIMEKNKLSPKKKIKIIGNGSSNGIDTSYFSPSQIKENLRSKYKIGENDVVFCFVGRLVKDKGINELIEAFTSLLTTNYSIKLLLVGDMETALDPLLSETVHKIESTEEIITVGWQDDIRPYLAMSDIFTFPSYREGFPNVVLQASAMELPCIVSDINGCNEIITHGENGEIIPVKDASALKESMTKLLENTAYRNTLKQNTRQQIIDKYEQQFVWNELLKEYNSLLKK